VVESFQPVYLWDRLYLGGGNARRISPTTVDRLGERVLVADNSAGILGGVRAWDMVR